MALRNTTGDEILRLIELLSKLPGLGPRSGRRVALHLIRKRDAAMAPLLRTLAEVAEKAAECSVCGAIDTRDPCAICCDPARNRGVICVVEQAGDLWAFERAGMYDGQYHVLGGLLSALDGISPEELRIPELVARAREPSVKEVVIGLNATIDAQTTAHYIADALIGTDVTVSGLARGVPIGGELDYLDEGTIAAAFQSRRAL